MDDCINAFKTGNKSMAERLLPHTTRPRPADVITSFKFRSLVATVTMVFLLHLAAYWGWKDIVILLVTKYNCVVNKRDDKGHIALHYAAYNGHLDVVKYFTTELRCKPENSNNDGETSLYLACENGHLNIAQYLINVHQCNPSCRCNDDGAYGWTPLHAVCRDGHLHIAKYLITEVHCDPSCEDSDGETPLHIACHNGHFDIIEYLINEEHCDPSCKDKTGETPLHVACFHRFVRIVRLLLSSKRVNPLAENMRGETPLYYAGDDYDIISIFKPFDDCKCKPIHTFTKVILVGDSKSGKTTVAKRLANKSKSKHKLTDVERFTAGIIPLYIEGKNKLGNFVLYDFASQQEYFSSHEAVLERLMGKFAVMFVCMVNLSESKKQICESLHYWISFVDNACSTAEGKSQMVIVGSHADKVTSEETEEKSSLLQEIAVGRIKHQEFIGYVSMDCRDIDASFYLSSILTNGQKSIIACQPNISYKCHVLYAFLRTKLNVTGCTLDTLIAAIAKENDPSLPNDPTVLTELLTTLSDKGLILFVQRLWVIVKIKSLLHELLRTIFAFPHFKEYCNLASNTGVVPVSNLLKVFPDYNLKMLIGFLKSLNFCRPLDPSVLQYTNLQTTLPHSTADLLFFPGLVQSKRPKNLVLQGKLKFGWCLKCIDPHMFFSSCFLHDLLLSVAYKFPLESQVASSSVSGLQRTCTVWRNGIFWRNLDNITTVIELLDKNRCVLVAMSCDDTSPVEHAELRSSLIALVSRLQQQYCSRLNVCEFLISPDLIQKYPLDNLPDSCLFEIQHVAQSMLQKKKCVPSYKDGHGYLTKEALPFEPYHQLIISSPSIIQIFNPNKADQLVPGPLLQEVKKLCRQLKGPLKFNKLREHLDRLSLFAGRDPLVSYVAVL